MSLSKKSKINTASLPAGRLGLRTWIEIDKTSIKKNYRTFRKLTKRDCLLLSVVKSNAYGHDLIEFSKEMDKLGTDWLGVDSVTEALALRDAGVTKPILILGYTLPERFAEASEKNISLTISSKENLSNLLKFFQKNKNSNPARIHLKIDTGMHRQGFFLAHLSQMIKILKNRSDRMIIEGIYTHFAAAKNPSSSKDTRDQIQEFKEAIGIIRRAGFNPIRHAAATSGTIVFPEAHFDMVRIGIGLYGHWPSEETKAVFEQSIKLHPAITWKTIIGEIKNLPKGSRLGYDFTETLKKDSKIAICPIGYWHGYPRNLSSIGKVLINGQKAKIIGRISMDMIIIDVSDIKTPKIGQEVVLLGENKKEMISADEIAHLANTTSYEIITRLNPLMRRFYI